MDRPIRINGVMGNLFNPVMFEFITGYTCAKLYDFVRKNSLESDKKRFWDSDLESLNDGKMCDSVPIPADLVGGLIGKEDLEWYDDEKYEPDSEL